MRTRSSRFFVLLLHLVIYQPHSIVQPWPVQLEQLQLPTLDEPIWLQHGELCLGPDARLSECGDATLWLCKRYARRKPFLSGYVGEWDTEMEVGWTFQVVDREYTAESENDEPKRRRRRKRPRNECLDVRKDGILEVTPCGRSQSPKRGLWTVDDSGRLQTLPQPRQRLPFQVPETPSPQCLHHVNDTIKASECGSNATDDIHFTFVRYRAVSVPPDSIQVEPRSRQVELQHQQKEDPLPTTNNYEPSMHPELKLSSQLLFSRTAAASASNQDSKNVTPFSLLSNSHPILLMNHHQSPTSSAKTMKPQLPNLAATKSMKVARIQRHPYIKQAKNELWKDPQTGLEYWTDLSAYLGAKEKGRHTLMGVGQYRKGYVIKVYGIAYYVSKRDVLADPFFEPYARMSDEDLRTKPEFYHHLRTMNYQNPDTTKGNFERTLMLKINMQLSAETMRSSLQADWRMLTEEAKDTLIGSSLKPRPADEDMLKVIQSPDNPSRCSCSQIAPPEYQADPACCARGTELVFTWLKNGDLGVRLNGRLMEVFPRPDIAEGIFFEYLRYDDPISPELRERVVDGFPFLLGPLSQIQGMGSKFTETKRETRNFFRPVINLGNHVAGGFMSLGDLVVGNAGSMAEATRHHVGEAMDHTRKGMIGMADSVMHMKVPNVQEVFVAMRDSAQGFADEMLRHREHVLGQSFPGVVFKILTGDNASEAEVETEDPLLMQRNSSFRWNTQRNPLVAWIGETYAQAADEIDPMIIHPSMDASRRVFLALVHLYLLLLFIVSFPGSYSTRSKIIIRKSTSGSFEARSSRQEPAKPKSSLKQKSLSYFL